MARLQAEASLLLVSQEQEKQQLLWVSCQDFDPFETYLEWHSFMVVHSYGMFRVLSLFS